jgi:transcriptional regulator with XRE-family HTH domain
VDTRILRVFGKNLNRLRTNSEITQEKLAERADISLRYIQQLEAGQRNPSMQTLVRLRKVIGCSFDDLFRGL